MFVIGAFDSPSIFWQMLSRASRGGLGATVHVIVRKSDFTHTIKQLRRKHEELAGLQAKTSRGEPGVLMAIRVALADERVALMQSLCKNLLSTKSSSEDRTNDSEDTTSGGGVSSESSPRYKCPPSVTNCRSRRLHLGPFDCAVEMRARNARAIVIVALSSPTLLHASRPPTSSVLFRQTRGGGNSMAVGRPQR